MIDRNTGTFTAFAAVHLIVRERTTCAGDCTYSLFFKEPRGADDRLQQGGISSHKRLSVGYGNLPIQHRLSTCKDFPQPVELPVEKQENAIFTFDKQARFQWVAFWPARRLEFGNCTRNWH